MRKMMKYRIYDKKHHFFYYFDTSNGSYLRTGIIKDGKDTGVDAFQASFPHLIDIGIMGHCEHGKKGLCFKSGVECYQNGLKVYKENMALEDFKTIIKQCHKKTNQVALGGRGDPNQHEAFEDILKECTKYNIVPSYTTSGLEMTDYQIELSKIYCGAVAVSWYRNIYTQTAIEKLVNVAITTNIHYVLSSSTIDEAITLLESNTFPKGINAVIFLLHKPKGLGSQDKVLRITDTRLNRFFQLIDQRKFSFQVGFDSCTVPGIINFSKNYITQSIDTCEGARFSCYIDSELYMMPCSFDVERKYGISLRNQTIEDAWNSQSFDRFRWSLQNRCGKCPTRVECMGGCPLMPEIVLCKSILKTKEVANEV